MSTTISGLAFFLSMIATNLKKAPNKEHRIKLKNSSKIASRIGFVVCVFRKLQLRSVEIFLIFVYF